MMSDSRNAVVTTVIASSLLLLLKEYEIVGRVKGSMGKIILFLSFTPAILCAVSLVGFAVFEYISQRRGFGSRFGMISLALSLLFPDRWLWAPALMSSL